MKKEERQQLRDEARAKLEKFWNERIQPLHESAAAVFKRLYQYYEEKERELMKEISSRLGLEVDDIWVADSPHGMPEGKYLVCYAVEDRDGQVDMPAYSTSYATGAKVSEWKYRQNRFLPYDSKLAYLAQRGKARLYREHMAARAQEYDPYFDQVARAWREIGADDYLVGRLSRLMTFKEVWDLIVHKTSYRPMKESLDAFRKLHNIPPLSFREELEQSGYPVEQVPRVVEPRNEGMERAAQALGIKTEILEADIRDLAWVWETTTGDMDLRNPLSALDILDAIVRAYIRGRNCRMGNYQTLWKHLPTKAAVMYQLARYAAKENTLGGYVLFPRLRDCAVTSVDEFLVLAKKLSMERSRRQEAQEMRRAEETRKTEQQKKMAIIENLRGERQGKYDILDEIRRFVDGDERR